jgi:hypothetical protein
VGRPSSLSISTVTKRCGSCGETKPRSEFYPRKDSKHETHYSRCKACHIVVTNANPKLKARIKAWAARNRERRAETTRKWRARHPERAKEVSRRWQENNPHKLREQWRRKGAVTKQAIPQWADLHAMHAIYLEASRRSTATGVPHNVDHIVPLRSPLVCGLHCEANLQILPCSENFSKGNRHWPDMPC